MKAAILYKLGAPLVVEDIEILEPDYGQVLVKVAASGVCHTQLLEIQGKRGVDQHLPHTLGHEGSGVVKAVGHGITRVTEGDHVVISWIKAAGINAHTPTYYRGKQRINAGAANTFMEYTLVSENRVTPISKDMPLDKAALLGCAVPTGMGAIINTAQVKLGTTVAVFGAGGIGLCAIQAAALVNAAMIIAIDIYEYKLELARTFGATHTLNARKQNPVPAIKELTNGRGVDYAIEVAGLKQTMEQAFTSVRDDGGLAVIIGNLPYQRKISIDPFALIKGRRIIGDWGGETNPDRDFPRYIDLYLTGKIKLDELISHRFQLEDINSAFSALANGKVARAIVEF